MFVFIYKHCISNSDDRNSKIYTPGFLSKISFTIPYLQYDFGKLQAKKSSVDDFILDGML